MSKLWKLGLRWISLLCLAGILSTANGCGGGGGGDDDIGATGGNGGYNPARDTTPDAYTIAPQTNVAMNAEVTSAPVTVTGIDSPTPISISDGSYSIDGGTFVNTSGTVTNKQTVRVRHRTSTANNDRRTTTLNIGGVTAPFVSFTVPSSSQDIRPDTFAFNPLTGAALGRSLTSNTITVSGVNAFAPISITGGTYSIGNGSFTADPGVVGGGRTVTVSTNSSNTYNSVATATLTIGGQSAPFTVTTMQSGGATTTPAEFTFTNISSVPVNTTVTSTPITVSGVTTAGTTISVSGGTYSIGAAPFTSTAGMVANNQSVRVQHRSSSYKGFPAITTLNIGGVTGTFESRTERHQDRTPESFSFTPQTNTPLGATVTSNEITVSGLGAPASITVYGGSYSIDNGPFTTASGTVNNGQRVAVRHTAAATTNVATVTTLMIGLFVTDFVSKTGSVIGTTRHLTPPPQTTAPSTRPRLKSTRRQGTSTARQWQQQAWVQLRLR